MHLCFEFSRTAMAYYLRNREHANNEGPSSSEGEGGDVAAMPVVVEQEQEPPWLRGFVAQCAAAVGQAVAEQLGPRRRGVGRRRPRGRVGRLLAPSSGEEEDDEDGYASPAGSVASIASLASRASRASRSLQGSPAPRRPEARPVPDPPAAAGPAGRRARVLPDQPAPELALARFVPYVPRKEPKCKFDGGPVSNPLVFLEELEAYLADQQVPEHARLGVATDCLRGNAHDWGMGEVRLGTIRTFAQFREALLREYWDDDRQELYKMEMYRSRWSPSSGVGMAEWFVSMCRRAQFLDPPLPERQLVCRLAHHFPESVSAALLADGNMTLAGVRSYLRRLDGAKMWRKAWVPAASERPQQQGGHSHHQSAAAPRRPVPVRAIEAHQEDEAEPAAAEPPKGRRKNKKKKKKQAEEQGSQEPATEEGNE